MLPWLSSAQENLRPLVADSTNTDCAGKADSQTSISGWIRIKNDFALCNFHETIGGMTRSSDVPAGRLSIAIAIVGFGAVATAQATNMILARANGGYIPPFALAFFRWAIVAFGLLPLSFAELHTHQKAVRSRWWQILVTGFLGMFVCGGPIYIAGVTTTAINIGLIMAMSPIVVLVVSWWSGLETIAGLQRLGIVMALIGALFVMAHGRPAALFSATFSSGDVITLIAMLGWSAYTLLQTRLVAGLSHLTRVCVFAFAGALFSLPPAIIESINAPQRVFSSVALGVYLFAGLVPGIFAYGGFSLLGAKYGPARSSLVMYMAPIASVLLSSLVLREAPDVAQIAGGGLILAGMWLGLRK
jgi:drug/metabolite transporter (DMT)-like permease